MFCKIEGVIRRFGTNESLFDKTFAESEAHEILTQTENRSTQDYISPVWLACLYHALGEIDKSFGLLGKAYEEKDSQLVYIAEHAWFDNFRSDPRFNELLKKMNLE